jgi:hypothetical protein
MLLLANTAHVKNVPCQDIDVADAVWLAGLMQRAPIRASFVPEPTTPSIRALLCTRMQLAREQAGHVQRLQKMPKDANVMAAPMLASVFGLRGRAIIQALIEGETDHDTLVALKHHGVEVPCVKIWFQDEARVS